MMKDKYWHVGYPLAVVALCVSPRETFKEHWMDLITSGLAKMKVSLFLLVTSGVNL